MNGRLLYPPTYTIAYPGDIFNIYNFEYLSDRKNAIAFPGQYHVHGTGWVQGVLHRTSFSRRLGGAEAGEGSLWGIFWDDVATEIEGNAFMKWKVVHGVFKGL